MITITELLIYIGLATVGTFVITSLYWMAKEEK